MLGDNYITTDEVVGYMKLQESKYDPDRVASVCSAVSREVERYCKRQFNQADSVSVRQYVPNDWDLCIVDDFFTTSGLIIQTDDNHDGLFETTWTAGVDYQLEPINGIVRGMEGFPYWKIRATGYNRHFHRPRHNRATVQVTAQWGWAEVPDLVHEAALMLASDTYQIKDSRMGVAGSDQFGTVVRVRENLVAANKLRYYARQKVMCA